MAFQGIALFALGAVGLASFLYYMYSNNVAQGYGDYGTVYSPVFNNRPDGTSSTSQSHTSKNRESTRNRKKRKSKESSFEQTPELECTICLQKINDEELRLPCSHKFHMKCMEEWRSQGPIISRYTCPNCRKSYTSNE